MRPLSCLPTPMKKYLIILAVLASVLCMHLVADPTTATPPDHTEEVKSQFNQDLKNLVNEVSALLVLSKNSKKDLGQVEQSFKRVRLAFKRAEYLLEYYDPEFVKKRLNGANLYWLNESVPEIEEIAPHGLQVLEESLFAEPESVDWQFVSKELEVLHKLLKGYQERHLERAMYDYQVWEAMRYELVRIFTLGLTGFDSPVLLHSLPEAKTSLQSLSAAYELYQDQLAEKNEDLSKEIGQTFKGALTYIDENDDFDSFDRLHFLREFIDPLFRKTLEAQQEIRAYIPSKYYTTPSAFNYEATSLFANDFLNASYYSKFNGSGSDKVKQLGQTLFYDPILSQNNKRACASCHLSEKAFTDGRAKSLAFDGEGEVKRNAPTLINSAYSDRYFYDFSVVNIEDQTEMVVNSHQEFATSYKEVVDKINKSEAYQKLFQEAFEIQKGAINRNTLTYALAEYVRSLNSFDSEFDQYARGETDEISKRVANGFNLFAGKAGCATCHFVPVFNGTVPPNYIESESEVLGTLANEDLKNPVLDEDAGRYESWKQNASIFYRSFKTVTVRNVALTAPYMHNGAFSSLENVVAFYNKGGGKGLGLSVPNQTLPEDELGLSKREQQDIVLFMEALTDTSGLTRKPTHLPVFANDKKLSDRVVGGEY